MGKSLFPDHMPQSSLVKKSARKAAKKAATAKVFEMVEANAMKKDFDLPKISRWSPIITQRAKQDDITTDTALSDVEKSTPSHKGALHDIEPSELFEKAAEPIVTKVPGNQKQSATTQTKLRDTLLPKLISGELRIRVAEKLAEELSSNACKTKPFLNR
ncbi:hypothetical protein [Pelagicoccus sp. SDUM812005]|uniref:hypothetical protein n=1 Tax=Pelagicoccus sp. SDUM812005 TaxID=3041257 RepID=UPI00280CD4B2|nr:hypothetical protein [Pelagicoccus sp. SDUM812005]MDQ8182529.1 hypothetical protein [Pelagicoccus sp. SDUM812005]